MVPDASGFVLDESIVDAGARDQFKGIKHWVLNDPEDMTPQHYDAVGN